MLQNGYEAQTAGGLLSLRALLRGVMLRRSKADVGEMGAGGCPAGPAGRRGSAQSRPSPDVRTPAHNAGGRRGAAPRRRPGDWLKARVTLAGWAGALAVLRSARRRAPAAHELELPPCTREDRWLELSSVETLCYNEVRGSQPSVPLCHALVAAGSQRKAQPWRADPAPHQGRFMCANALRLLHTAALLASRLLPACPAGLTRPCFAHYSPAAVQSKRKFCDAAYALAQHQGAVQRGQRAKNTKAVGRALAAFTALRQSCCHPQARGGLAQITCQNG